MSIFDFCIKLEFWHFLKSTRFARFIWNNFVKTIFSTGNNPLDFRGVKNLLELAWDLIFLQLFSLFYRESWFFVPFFCVFVFEEIFVVFKRQRVDAQVLGLLDGVAAAVLKAKRLRLYKHNRRIAWFRPTANSRTPTTFGNATRQKMLVSCWAGKRNGHLFIGSSLEKPKTTKWHK